MRDIAWKSIEWRCDGCGKIVEKHRMDVLQEPILCATCLEEDDTVQD